ncbi:MAG: zinc ribbon-containing protein [Sideroxyarcus sp.]|nr:zinc ribbon-containing protein [Sideroxyarcus sp.]
MNPVESEKKPDPEIVAGDLVGVAEQGEHGHHEALYDRFAERVREIFDAGQEKSKEAMEKAMESAREQLSAAGEFSAEQGEVFKRFMHRDLEQTARDMRTLGQEAKERLHPARLGAGALSSMARLLEATGLALQSLSRKAEDALHYNTGDITTAGTLTCTHCGQTLHLKRTTKIPPCPSCHGTEFRKGY